MIKVSHSRRFSTGAGGFPGHRSWECSSRESAVAGLATFLLATWFITSSDSGTLVITTMLSMGNDDPPKKFRIVWGLGEGFGAAVLLLAGGLKALQTASIAAALPVSVIMLMMTYGIVKSLHEDSSALPDPGRETAPDGTSLEGELHT
jgi:choline/glycine/proline betaine transport protein